MFNIFKMTLGEIVKGILLERRLKQADLIRMMNAINPEVDISTLQGAIRLLITRKSTSSKYITLIARAFKMSVDELMNWQPGGIHQVNQDPVSWNDIWPFGKRVTPDQYMSLSSEQKEIVVSRIVTMLDENKIKSSAAVNKNKAIN